MRLARLLLLLIGVMAIRPVQAQSGYEVRGYALLMACDQNDTLGVRGLLRAGLKANVPVEVRTDDGIRYEPPLFYAALADKRACARELLRGGADVNLADTTVGGPALVYAALNGHAEMVRLLLSRGADPKLGATVFTPLSAAASAGRTDIMDILMHAGAEDYGWAMTTAALAGRDDAVRFLGGRGLGLDQLLLLGCRREDERLMGLARGWGQTESCAAVRARVLGQE